MDRDIKRAELRHLVRPNKNCGQDMVIEGKAIIREARHLSYKKSTFNVHCISEER